MKKNNEGFIKLNAKKEGNKIIIDKDSLEYISLCLCSQKFMHEMPSCGDEMDVAINRPEEYKNSKEEGQAVIDNCYKQMMDIIHG